MLTHPHSLFPHAVFRFKYIWFPPNPRMQFAGAGAGVVDAVGPKDWVLNTQHRDPNESPNFQKGRCMPSLPVPLSPYPRCPNPPHPLRTTPCPHPFRPHAFVTLLSEASLELLQIPDRYCLTPPDPPSTIVFEPAKRDCAYHRREAIMRQNDGCDKGLILALLAAFLPARCTRGWLWRARCQDRCIGAFGPY